jgi:hypothetical protein
MLKLEVFQISDRQYRHFEDSESEFEEYELLECDLIERYFITIDTFTEYIDKSTGTRCTSFYSGGMEWISPIDIDTFLKMITRK